MRAVLDEARSRCPEVWLEVLLQNDARDPLYERLGFEDVRGHRRLGSSTGSQPASEVPETSVDERTR